MIYIGIDPSLTGTGIVVLDEQGAGFAGLMR
jgi:hypothetical protein